MSNKNKLNNKISYPSNQEKKSKDIKGTFGKLFKHLECKKIFLVSSILLSIFGVFLYVIAALALGEIIQFFFSPQGQNDYVANGFLGFLTGWYSRNDWRSFLVSISILITCYLVFCISLAFQNVIMVSVSQKTSYKLRKAVFDKLQKMPISYFDSHSSGDLMSRMTNDIDNISQGLTQSLSQFVQSILTIFVSLIFMLIMSSYLTLITIVLLPLLMSLSFIFIKKAQPHFKIQQEKIGDLNGYIEEMISGQRMANLLNRQNEIANKFGELNNSLVKSAVKSQTYSGFMFPWFSFASNVLLLVVSCIAVVFSLNKINIGGLGSFSSLEPGIANIAFITTFTLLLRNLINPISQLLGTMNVIQAGLAGAGRVFKIIELKHLEDAKDAKELRNVKGHVVFKNVDFGYTSKKLNLKNANINAKPGETIAIVGPTGAGKTTIINLLTKFYRYNSGEIYIDGKEINKVKEKSWRDNISIVLQDTFLFSNTVKENIRYGNLNASDEDVIKAAKIANAHKFIMQLKHGYDTVLSSDGKDLSQGQRQLLAIARAVISKSNILILDEATSSVDTRTEAHIQSAMLRLMKGRTSFVIAHRLSTIKNANQILVINDGKIIEQGSHRKLLKIKNGFYSNLYHSQFKNGIVSE